MQVSLPLTDAFKSALSNISYIVQLVQIRTLLTTGYLEFCKDLLLVTFLLHCFN